MFQNRMPRYEILSQEAMATLDRGWRRLMTEIGVEFMDDRALDLFRKAGQRVEDKTVFLDPDFVLAQVAKAPREFDLQARNPANSVHIGGDSMVFSGVYGPPFVRAGDVRRSGSVSEPSGPGRPDAAVAGLLGRAAWSVASAARRSADSQRDSGRISLMGADRLLGR